MRHARAIASLVLFLATASVALSTEFVKGPYLQEVTSTGVTVMWETDVAEPATVEYGPTGALGRVIETRGAEQPAAVRIKGLRPDSKYFYKVTEGDASSPSYSFVTLPEKGAFNFVVYGDSRSLPRDHAKVIAAIAGKRPDFVLHVGDFVGDGADASQWGPQFWLPAGPLMARVGMFTVPGNHEEESPNYYRYLGSRSLVPWYSFDCVNAHFVMLNSCLDLSPGSPQHEWLTADLAATDKRWRFVVMHHPLYSSGAHGSSVGLRESLEPVLRRYGVDIVFAGHDHHYERTLPMVSAFGPKRPITHVVTGGGGAPRRPVKGDFFTDVCLSELNFCLLDIDQNVLKFTAFDGDGRPFDQLRIVKLGETYANTYPGESAAIELAAAEAAVEKTLRRRYLDYPAEDRVENVEFEIVAPEWSPLALTLAWHNEEGAARLHPERLQQLIKPGQALDFVFDLSIKANELRCPSVSVTGATSLGEFRFDASPLRLRTRPEEQ